MSIRSPNRAATASITGYAYQFDLTTLEILAASNMDTITVEGCEDIDLNKGTHKESVQCKYLESAKYSLTTLRKPILPMLKAFNKGQCCNYRLYVHYGDASGVPERLTIDELKQSLTESKRAVSEVIKHYDGIDDAILQGFLDHFVIQSGEKFADQQAEVYSALRNALNGTDEDINDLHYPKAVAVVMELAMRSDERDREITRPKFLELVNKRPEIYTRWHKEIIGVECFRGLLKRRIKSVGLLTANKRRLIVVESPAGVKGDLIKVSHLIEKLATEMYGAEKLSTAKPWTVVLDAPDDEVEAIKKGLIEAEIAFNDGFEHLLFSPALFDRDPTINTDGRGKRIKATSYDIRLVSASCYEAHLRQLQPPAVVISFAASPAGKYVDDQHTQTLDVPGWRPEEILNLLEVAK